MRRPVLTLTAALVAALLATVTSASAVGPGGWEHVGGGSTSSAASLDGAVYALSNQQPGFLLVGGAFTSAGGNAKAKRVARWNGSTWSALGNTPLTNGAVNAIAYHAGKTYVGGTFVNAGGDADADFLAVWDGSTWSTACTSTVPGPAITATVYSLQIIGNTLYVAGAFADGAGIATADRVVACDLTTGVASSTVSSGNEFNSTVYALTADSNGTLYAGGGFIDLASIPDADHVASYDGSSWHAVGSGTAIDSFVRSLTASGTNVYVGTDSINVAGIAQADHVARWNGSSWSAVGSNGAGTDGWFPETAFIDSLTTYGSLVVAGGSFQNAGGNAAADELAYFDGTTWRPLGSDGSGNGPLNQQATALAVFGGRAYVGGSFTAAGGDQRASYLAASSLRQPDAAVGGSASGAFRGANVYSPTGAGEVRDVTVHRGDHATAYVRIQNRGQVSAAFTIHGTGGAQGLTATYFRGSSDITSRVRAGNWSTGNIAPRTNIVIRIVVHAAHGSADRTTFVTAAASFGASPDAVRVAVTAKG